MSAEERCFACGLAFRGGIKTMVETSDLQRVYVGKTCFEYIKAAGGIGYQPPKGGPRLYLFFRMSSHD